MASTRLQQGQLISQAKTNGFLDQVTGALIAMAVAVYSEASGVTDHANRLAFARAIANNPTSIATYMLPGYLSNTNIKNSAGTPASILDSDVDTATLALFNTYADQYVAQTNIGVSLQFGS